MIDEIMSTIFVLYNPLIVEFRENNPLDRCITFFHVEHFIVLMLQRQTQHLFHVEKFIVLMLQRQTQRLFHVEKMLLYTY